MENSPPYWKLGVRVDLRPLEFEEKIALNFGEGLFFWRSHDFLEKNALNFGEDLYFILFFLEIT